MELTLRWQGPVGPGLFPEAGDALQALAVPGVYLRIKRYNDDGTLTTVGRDGLGAAQAPMAYGRAMLDRALAEADDMVDESLAVEAIGGRVVAVAGELTNLHVTDRESLAVVRHLAALV